MTQKQKWTEGPWKSIAGGERIIGANFDTVAAILAPANMAATVEDPDVACANGRLIAAAPELAKAAWPLVEAISLYEPSAGEDDDEPVPVRLGDLKALQAAYRRARGEG